MKKTYKNPSLVVVRIASKAHVLAGSQLLNVGTTSTDPGSADSRYFDFDDDEE